MSPRDTRTGGVLENMILPALSRGGYSHETQKVVGTRLGGSKHRVDVLAEKNSEKYLISLKWQQVSGTAEQKVPFEYICLCGSLKTGDYKTAYVVLGGEGWKLRSFYVSGGLEEYIKDCSGVKIVTLENFVALANTGKL